MCRLAVALALETQIRPGDRDFSDSRAGAGDLSRSADGDFSVSRLGSGDRDCNRTPKRARSGAGDCLSDCSRDSFRLRVFSALSALYASCIFSNTFSSDKDCSPALAALALGPALESALAVLDSGLDEEEDAAAVRRVLSLAMAMPTAPLGLAAGAACRLGRSSLLTVLTQLLSLLTYAGAPAGAPATFVSRWQEEVPLAGWGSGTVGFWFWPARALPRPALPDRASSHSVIMPLMPRVLPVVMAPASAP